jgi:hypothetical protein
MGVSAEAGRVTPATATSVTSVGDRRPDDIGRTAVTLPLDDAMCYHQYAPVNL